MTTINEWRDTIVARDQYREWLRKQLPSETWFPIYCKFTGKILNEYQALWDLGERGKIVNGVELYGRRY